jgi:hypothetical protein
MRRPPSQKVTTPDPPPPDFFGTARVREARGGLVVKKTLSVPIELAERIAAFVPTHRRSSDGLISGNFSDVAIDLLREALDRRAADDKQKGSRSIKGAARHVRRAR